MQRLHAPAHLCRSVANSLTSSITLGMIGFYPDNLNGGHLEYLYGVHLLIVLGAIPVFLWLMKGFRNKNFVGTDTIKPTDKSDAVTSEPASSDSSQTEEAKCVSV